MDNNTISNLITNFFSSEELLMSGMVRIEDILDSVQSSSSSESSSSSDDSEREETIKGDNFCDVIDNYSSIEFRTHMRLRRSTVEFLIEKYSATIAKSTNPGGRARVTPRTKVYLYIWYIGHTVTFRNLSRLFGISNSTAWHIINTLSSWIISSGHKFIKWPQDAAATEVEQKFKDKNDIPGIIGVIGCTHIQIKAPNNNKENYFNRAHTYSLVLQAVVDPDKRFTDLSCGEPGSMNSSKVLRRSNLFIKAQLEGQELFPKDYFLLGDSTYSSTSWLVSQFKDDKLTMSQRLFNKLHSSTHLVVVNAFSLLKARFRRLQHFSEQMNLCFMVNIIVSACVLHNICIDLDDVLIDDFKDSNLQKLDNNIKAGLIEDDIYMERRDLLFKYLQENKVI